MSEYDNTNSGALFKNTKRETDKHPEYTGTINVEGTEYWMSSWVNESKSGNKYFSIKLKKKDFSEAKEAVQQSDSMDTEIPF